MDVSQRVRSLAPSSTVAMMNRAKTLIAQGVDVLSFSAGEPDFDTPRKIKDAAIAALNAGLTKYMPTAGDLATRTVIAQKLARENGIPGVTPEHVVISAGGKHSLFVLFHCLFDGPPWETSGGAPQEAVLPVPAWVSYAPQIELAGGKVVPIDAGPKQGFKATPEQVREAITERTRVFVLNSPGNPTGAAYTPDEIILLAEAIEDAASDVAPDLVVVSDEIYEKIVYDGAEHMSIGSIGSIAERVVTVNGLSKAYAMTGWRVGYAAGTGEFGLKIARAMATLQGQMSTNITSFVYPAIRTALTECAADVEQMRQAFAQRAALIGRLIENVPGFVCPKPTGAFYVFPDVSAHFGKTSAKGKKIDSASAFCDALLDEAKVAFVPGEDFGGCGARCVRISFACSEEQIEKGMTRLGEFVAGLK